MRKSAMGVLGLVTGMALTTVGGIVASVGNTYADGVEFSATVESSMNITLTADTVSLNLNPANAAFASQTLTASVGTNNLAGYTMTMSSANDATVLSRTEAISGSTPTIATLASAVSESNFPANRWGYRFDSGNYQPYASGMTYSSSLTAVNPEDSAKTITFGAKVDTDQPYGTYELDLVFTAVARTLTYNLTYYGGLGGNGQGSTGVTDIPSATSATGTNVSIADITLSSTTPTRSGYTFGGWCDAIPTIAADGSSSCSGTTYTAGGVYHWDYTTSAGLNEIPLYAIWGTKTNLSLIANFDATMVNSIAVKSGSVSGTTVGTISTTGGSVSGLTYATTYYLVPNIKDDYKFTSWTQVNVGTGGTGLASTSTQNVGFNVGDGTNAVTLTAELDKIYMQTMSASQCVTGSSTTVADSRDGKEYTVQRLADGKCWMTSNLNLAGGTVLSSDKSDVPSTNYYTLPTSTAISSGTSVPSDQFSDNYTAYVFNTGNETTSQSDCTSSSPCNSYYSWLAATAGGKDSSGNAVTTNGYNAAYSICPKGWRLPTSTTSNADPLTSPNWKTGDWYALATAYGANLESNYYETAGTFYTNAGPGTTPNFLLAGYYYSGSFGNGGSGGDYWSSTSSSGANAYSLYFNSSYVNSANYNNRRYGFSVRCVLAEQ